MSIRFGFAKGAMLAAAASIGLLVAPQLAAAQPGGPSNSDQDGYNGQGGTYYDPCARSQADRSVVGGLLGAVAGATLGNSVTHGGAKVGGAIIGGVAGAAAGASIGHATAACEPGQPVPYAGEQDDQGYGPPPPPPPGAYIPSDAQRYAGQPGGQGYGPPPPPPPPPPGAYIPGDDQRYAGPNGYPEPQYRDAPRQRCQMVEDRVFFPDGTSESSSVQACRDPRGHWRVVE